MLCLFRLLDHRRRRRWCLVVVVQRPRRWRCEVAQGRGCRGRNAAAVIARELLERLAGGQDAACVLAVQQASQFLDSGAADHGERAVDGFLHLGRERRRLGDRLRTARDDELALNAEGPLSRRLIRCRGPYLVIDVVVELVERYHAILVAVGVTGLQTFDERAREHRRRQLVCVGQFVALECVLHSARRCDHRAPAAAELRLYSDSRAGPGCHPALECPGITAVQQQNNPPRTAAVHPPIDEFGGHPGRRQPAQRRVRHCEVQFAVLIFDAVARKVQEQQIIGDTIGEEFLDGKSDLIGRCVQQRPHVKAANGRILQYSRERTRIAGRRSQLPQAIVLITIACDDQRAATASHRATS